MATNLSKISTRSKNGISRKANFWVFETTKRVDLRQFCAASGLSTHGVRSAKMVRHWPWSWMSVMLDFRRASNPADSWGKTSGKIVGLIFNREFKDSKSYSKAEDQW